MKKNFDETLSLDFLPAQMSAMGSPTASSTAMYQQMQQMQQMQQLLQSGTAGGAAAALEAAAAAAAALPALNESQSEVAVVIDYRRESKEGGGCSGW